MSSAKLTHLDAQGRAQMVDVGEKNVTVREAIARAAVHMAPETLRSITDGTNPKGDVFAVARLAGIQAAKRTADWIPLAHPLALDQVIVDLQADETNSRVLIEGRARVQARTGVEMEALVAVSAASLTIYDMCKAIDRGMTIEGVRLVRKTGGKSGTWVRAGEVVEER